MYVVYIIHVYTYLAVIKLLTKEYKQNIFMNRLRDIELLFVVVKKKMKQEKKPCLANLQLFLFLSWKSLRPECINEQYKTTKNLTTFSLKTTLKRKSSQSVFLVSRRDKVPASRRYFYTHYVTITTQQQFL